MKRTQRVVGGLVLAVGMAAAILVSSPSADADEDSLRFKTTATNLILSDGTRTVLDYRYSDVPFKPYAMQLTTPGGVQILRDSPLDHKHHHGLMFALAVDGVNFWEETPAPGQQVHREFNKIDVSSRDGMSVASFGEQLDWIAPQRGVLLHESRRLKLYRSPGLGATLLTWSTRLETAADRGEVKLSGSNYFGLGMRFLESMDKVGQTFWADAKDSEVLPGGMRLTHSAWCAYTAPADGKPVTVAVFDHSSNPRHPATMFSMVTPFAYLSATLNLSKEAMTVTKDRPLVVRYGVALWDGKAEPAQVEALYRKWLTLEP